MNNQEIAIVGLSVLIVWLCWVIRGAVISSREMQGRIDRLETYRDRAVNDLHDLHFALYLDKEEAAHASPEQAVDRAKRLVVTAQNYEIRGFDIDNLKDAIFGKDKPAIPSIREATLVATEHREKAAKWDESQEEEVFHHICGRVVSGIGICNCEICCKKRGEEGHCRYPDRSEPLSPAMGVSGNVAEALIPTADIKQIVFPPTYGDDLLARYSEKQAIKHAQKIEADIQACLDSGVDPSRIRVVSEQLGLTRVEVDGKLFATADSIENAISHPDKNRFCENETVFEKRDRFLGNQVEAALAHAETRSNNNG